MKSINKIWILAVVILFITSSCTTYRGTLTETEGSLKSNDYTSSLESLDQNKFLNKKRNRLLFLLEKGKLEHLNKNYTESNNYLEQARYLIEDRSKNVGGKAAAMFTNPEHKKYEAEDFEKTTVYYYKALNFFQLGEYDNALIEAKRINIELNRLNDKYKNKKNKYAEDAFSHIVQGIVYEAQNDINNAFIAYRNATNIFLENGSYFGVSIPQQLMQDVLRTAYTLGFDNEYNNYLKIFNMQHVPNTTEGKQVILFWENGLGPAKGQTKITLSSVGGSYQNDDYGIFVPIPVGGVTGITSVAIPKYLQRGTFYDRAELVTVSQTKHLEPIQDYYSIAKQCLKDRLGRELSEAIARMIVKKTASKGVGKLVEKIGGGWLGKKATELALDGVGAALEKADTRNWQTLPNTIYYARIPVKNDEHSIKIRLYEGGNMTEKEFILDTSKQLEIINFVSFDKVNGENQAKIDEDDTEVVDEFYETLESNYEETGFISGDYTKPSSTKTKIENYYNSDTKNNEQDSPKNKLYGFGLRYSLVDYEFFSYSTVEPEITFYNNDKKLGFSISYGFLSGETELNSIYFESLSKIGSNVLIGFSNTLGMVFEGQYTTGYTYSDFDFTGFDYESYGGGLGVFYKGTGSKKTTALSKLIIGYNGSEFFGGGLYVTGGLNILF